MHASIFDLVALPMLCHCHVLMGSAYYRLSSAALHTPDQITALYFEILKEKMPSG
jgi:hypothetical protein